jgi:hypothetical protein
MPLSPADFYAYSRATGTPVPEDAEERARIASDVYDFRQNQLKTPEQGPNYGAIAGLGALGLGLAAGGVGLARALRGRAPQAAAKVVDQEVVRRVAQEAVPQSKVIVSAPMRPKQTSEIKPFNLTYIESTGAKAPDLTAVQQSEVPRLAAQQRAAVESGEDQTTGRFQHMLQLNEDLDTSQIDVMEAMAAHQYRVGMEQDEPSHVVTRQLPDGAPHIQQEDPVAGAQNFITQRRLELQKQGLSPGRIERELLEGPNQTTLKQGLELFASTGDPAAAKMISGTPSVPLVVKPSIQLKTAGVEEIPTGEFFETWKARELNTGKLEDRDIHYTNRISMLGDKLLTVPSHIPNPKHQELSETVLMAGHAWKQGDRSERVRTIGTNASEELKKVSEFIPNPEHTALSEEIAFANAQRNDVRAQIAAKQREVTDFAGVMKLKNLQEGVRDFAEVDPETQEIIINAQTGRPTVETRPGRPSLPAGTVEKAASETSIRGVGGASGTGLGSAPGVYEPGAVLSDVIIENGEEAYKPVMWQEGTHPLSLRTPEGYVYSEAATQRPTATQGKRFQTHPLGTKPPEVARRSVDVASEIRRLQSSNRPDAQQQLQQFMQTLRG